MSVFCVRCGTENDDDSLFCRKCGEKLQKDHSNGSGSKSRPKYDVFISHSSKNKNIADAICANFEQHRIKCWYAPRDIRAGESWPAAIKHGIEEAEILVLVFSENANESRQVINEVSIAYNCGKTIIPFKIADTPMNDDFDYFLNRVHWLDAMTQPIEESIDALRKYAENILGYTYSTYEEAPAASESQAVASEPEVVASEPEAVEVAGESEVVESEPEVVASEPETVEVAGEPEVVASEPEEVAGEPEVVASEPEAVEVAGESEVVESEPEVVASEPETVEVAGESEVVSSEPEAVEVAGESEVVESEPEVVASEPEAVEVAGESEEVAGEPEVVSSEPEAVEVAGESEVVTSEPAVVTTETESEPALGTESVDAVSVEEPVEAAVVEPAINPQSAEKPADIGKRAERGEPKVTEENVDEKRNRNNKIVIALVAVVAVLFLIAVFPTKAKKAKSLYNDGQYEQALELYKELGDQSGIYNATFSLAKEAEKQFDVDKALEYYTQIEEYPDVQEKILSIKHVKGKLLIESGDYDGAIEILSELGDDIFVEFDLAKAKFLKAVTLVDAGDYDEAISIFSEFDAGYKPDSSDYSADEMIKECKYKKAEKLINKDMDAAIALLEEIGDYQPQDSLLNAMQLMYKCNYEKANKYLSNEEYFNAIEIFEELESQKSNTVSTLSSRIPALLQTAKYSYVEENFNTKDENTRKYLDELSAEDYKDTVKKWAMLYGCIDKASIEDLGNPYPTPHYFIKYIGDAHFVEFSSDDLNSPQGLKCTIGGKISESTTIISRAYKDGVEVADSISLEIEPDSNDSWSGSITWKSAASWTGTHTVTLKFFDTEGHYLAEVTAKVINEE